MDVLTARIMAVQAHGHGIIAPDMREGWIGKMARGLFLNQKRRQRKSALSTGQAVSGTTPTKRGEVMETKDLRKKVEEIATTLNGINMGDDIIGVSVYMTPGGHPGIQLTEEAFQRLFATSYTISDFRDNYTKLSVLIGATEVMTLRKEEAQDG